MNAIQYLMQRLREPSTMAGLSAIALMVGVQPGVIDASVQLVAGAVAVLAVVLPERKP